MNQQHGESLVVKLRFFILIFLLTFKFRRVFGRLDAEMVADYFSSLNLSTVVLFTCSVNDEMMWQKYTNARNRPLFTGRGVIGKNCELNVNALKDTACKLGVFADYDCDCVKRHVMQVNDYSFISETYSWLFWSAELKPEDLESLQIKLQAYNEARFALQENASVIFYDVYRVYAGSSVRSFPAGSWNTLDRLIWHLPEGKYERRKNFLNVTLQAGLAILDFNISDPDLLTKLKDHNHEKNKDTVGRVFYTLWDVLREIHNFSVNITILNNFGYTKRSDGFYEGITGLLQMDQIDISIGGLGMLSFRLDFVNFNNLAILPSRSFFFFLQPRVLERFTLLINPFRGTVWLSSLLIMMVASIFISIIAVYDNVVKISVSSTFLYISAILGQQGAVLTSKWASGRFLLFTSLIFGFFLLNYYSGQVVSELLAPPPSTIITHEQLIRSSILLASDEYPFYKLRYKTQKTHHIPELGEKINRTGGHLLLEDGMQKVRSSLYAFETEDNKGYSIIDNTFSQGEICALGMIPMPTVEAFVALRRPSPFKEIFSISVIILKERGILKRLTKRWQHPKPQCIGGTSITPVDLVNASVAFYLLFLGGVMGSAILLVEVFISKRKLPQKLV